MKRSFLTTAALVVVFAFLASTATAQQTFLKEDWTGQSGATVSGWSVRLTAGANPSGDGAWRFDDIGGNGAAGPFAPPFIAPICTSDSDQSAQFCTWVLESTSFDVSSAGQVLSSFDYVWDTFGSAFAAGDFEVFDGSTWNLAATMAANGVGFVATNVSFDTTALMAASTNARVRFSHTGDFDWWFAVDNICVEEPAPVDVACSAVTAPFISTTACIHTLTATETVSVDIVNMGSAALVAGVDLLFVSVDFDTVNVLSESFSPGANVAPAGIVSYSTMGTVDMSAVGAHTLDVHTTHLSDANTANDTCTIAYTSPATAAPVNFGYAENFDGIVHANAGQFTPVDHFVPAGWINHQDDAASITAPGGASSDWSPMSGPTGSAGGSNGNPAGPLGDNTTGATNYMYIEDSPSSADDIVLSSPCLDLTGGTGSPTARFFHHSATNAGAANEDNTLHVDILNETTGVTTVSALSLPGNGVSAWVGALVDLSAFGTDIVRVQFRTNTFNGGPGNFVDDVAIDDFDLFDAAVGAGQAPQPGLAVFDVNNSLSLGGLPVASGANGPYSASVSVGTAMNMSWSGLPAQGVICWQGPLLVGATGTFGGIGQFDTGNGTVDMNGIPNGLAIVGDGIAVTVGAGSFFDSFFFTGIGGTGGVSLTVPDFFPPGVFGLGTYQCAMQDPVLGIAQVSISNAITVTLVP